MTRASRRPGARRWAVGALLAIAVLLVLVGALLVWQPTGLVRALLWVAGHDEITVEEIRVGLNGIDLPACHRRRGGSADPPIARRLPVSELLRGRIAAGERRGRDVARPHRSGRPAAAGPGHHGRGRRRANRAAGPGNARADLGPRRPGRARDPARPPDRAAGGRAPSGAGAGGVRAPCRGRRARGAGRSAPGGSAHRGRDAAGPAGDRRRDHRVGPIAAADRRFERAGGCERPRRRRPNSPSSWSGVSSTPRCRARAFASRRSRPNGTGRRAAAGAVAGRPRRSRRHLGELWERGNPVEGQRRRHADDGGAASESRFDRNRRPGLGPART